jgi:YD repeat-containing protein
MTSITTGTGLGLFNTSLDLLGRAAPALDPQTGRPGQADRVYINSQTGNLIIQQQDEYLASVGIDLGLVRTYNAQGKLDDDNADNWRLNVHQRLYGLTGTANTAGSTITKVYGDGAEALFTYDTAQGLYVSTAGDGAHDTLRYGNNTWIYTDGSQTRQEIYDHTGRLVNSRDADGNTTTYVYTGNLLTQITDASGQVTYLDYAGNNLSQIRTVSQGLTETKVRYSYDALNRLTTVTVDLTPADNSISDGQTYTTTYTYAGTSQRVASITHGDGSTVAFTYVQVGSDWKVASYTDGAGQTTAFAYNTATYTTTVTNALGQTTTYTSDSTGRLSRVTDALGQSARYTYDSQNNVTAITDANNHTTTFEYDTRGNRTLSRDVLGNTVTDTYDSNNLLLTETVYLVPDPDGAGAGQPGQPLTHRYAYDAESHLRFSVSADGRVSEYRYNPNGTRASVIQYAGAVYNVTALTPTDTLTEAQLATWATAQDRTRTQRLDTSYDFRGQVSSTTTYASVDAAGNGIADGSQSVTQFVYDQAGRLIQTIDARGTQTTDANDYVTNYTYDGLGRLLTTSQWVSSGVTRTTVTSYDDANNRTVTTLANGLATTSTFDRTGRLVSVSQSANSQTLGTTTYQYDAAGNLRITTDPTGLKTYALYDATGRLVATLDATGALTESVYDANGNVIKTIRYATTLTDAQLASLVDGNGDPADISLGAIRPPASADDRIAYTLYDQAGRAVMTIAPHDTDPGQGYVTRRFYDGAGRVTDVIEYAAPLSLAGLPALPSPDDVVPRLLPSDEDRHSRFFYDNDSMLLASLDAAGTLTRYRYGSSGRLEVSFIFAVAVDPMLHAGGDLDALVGSISAQTGGDHSGDLYTWYFHNNKGELTGVLDAESYLTEYRYDAAGNEIERIRYANRTTAYVGIRPTQELLNDLRPAPSANDRVTLTSYNGANQVVSVTALPENTVTAYTYDVVGNLIRTDRAWNSTEVRTTRARYDAQGRLTQDLAGEGSAALDSLLAQNPSASQEEIDALWSQWGLSHTYDAAGRRTRTTDQNGHATLFYYDPASRLAYTVNTLGEVTHNVYNALGQLIDATRHTQRIDTTGLSGGLVTPELEILVQAIASPAGANPDARTRYNYTLRGAVREAIYGPDSATEGKTAYAYNAFGERIAQTLRLDGTTSRLTEYRYDHRGRLTQTIEDIGGAQRTTQSEYDAFGRLIRTLDARSHATDYGYDRIGRRVTVTTADDTRTTTYDAFARVLAHTDVLNHTTTYSYDDATRRLTVKTPEGISTTTETNRHGETVAVTDGNGHTTTYAYDKNGNLIEVSRAEGELDLTTTSTYDNAGLKTETRHANGTVTLFNYDAANRMVLRTVDPTGLALTTSYSYDGQGRVLTTTDANGTVTETQYDAKGQVTSVTVDPSGLHLTTAYTHDEAGRTLTVTEGAGTLEAHTTQYTYDALGRRTAEIEDPSDSATGYVGLNLTTTYVYDLNGNLIAKTEGEGAPEARTTRYVYDAQNRLTDTVDALGAVSHRDYDAAGNLTRTVEYATAIDLTGLTTITAADLAARLTASPTDRSTGYAYDTDHRLVYTVNSLGYVTEASYDANGNVIAKTAYATAIPTDTATTEASIAQAVSLIADPTRDHLSHTVYDAANRAVYGINALGYVTESAYDVSGRVVQTTAYAALIALDGLPTRPTEADLAVALAARLAPQSGQDQISELVYDPAGRLTRLTQAVGTPDQFTETYAYDAVGRQLRHTNGRGDSEYAAYDAAGRRTRHIDYMGYVVDSSYDALGHLKTKTVYMTAVAQPTAANDRWAYEAPNPAPDTDPVSGDRTTSYEYDATGRLTDETDALGTVTHYAYDALGQVREKTLAYGTAEASTIHTVYDALGRLTEQTTAYGAPEASTSRFGYDAFGNQLTYIDPRGVELAETDSDWAMAERLRLGYTITDANGTRAALVAELATANQDALRSLYTTTQSYDALNRKVSVTDALGAITTTTYDAFGNIVKVTDPNGSVGYFYYDALNRVSFQVDPEGYATQTIYDASGNAIETVKYADKVQGIYSETTRPVLLAVAPASNPPASYLAIDSTRDQRTLADYDSMNRTARITDAENHAESFRYDANGNVTQKTDKNGIVTTYEYDLNNRRITEHLPITSDNGAGIQAPVINRYEYDAVGNTTMTIEAQGLPEERATQFVYDKANRLIETIEPQVLVQQLSVPASVGTLVASIGGTATMSIRPFINGLLGGSQLTVSWPPVTGLGKGNIKIVWSNDAGTFSATVAGSATSAVVNGQVLTVGAGAYQNVKILKEMSHGDFLLAESSGDYTARYYLGEVYSETKQISTVLHFTGQPTAGKTLRIAYWSLTDPNNITELDLASYSPGCFTGFAAQVLSGDYGYDAKVFDINGEVLNHITGTLFAGTSGTVQTKYTSGDYNSSRPAQLAVSWPPVMGFGNGKIRVVWTYHYGTYSTTVDAEATSAVVQGSIFYVLTSTPMNVKIYKESAQGDVLIAESPADYLTATTSFQTKTYLHFIDQPTNGAILRINYWPVSNPNDITQVDLASFSPGTFSGMVSQILSGGYEYDVTVLAATGTVLSHSTGGVIFGQNTISARPTGQVLLSGVLQTPHSYKSYDARGNVITETDPRGNITHHYYDANNLRLGTIDAEGYLHRYYYNAAGNLVAERTYGDRLPETVPLTVLPDATSIVGIDPNNYRETQYRYNANNLLVETRTREVLVYDRTDGLRTQSLVTGISYDANGNRVIETDPNGNNTYSFYNKAGKRIAQVDPLGYLSYFELDSNGNVLEEIHYASALSSAALATLSATSDIFALKTAVVSSPDDRTTVFGYDRMNRRIEVSTLNLAVTNINPANGNPTTDFQSAITGFEYDAAGNLKAQIDATGARTDYGYDGLNRRISEQDPTFTDFQGASIRNVTLLKYNGVSNVVSVTQRGKTTAGDQVTRYEYDPSGNLIKETDALGSPIRYYYDLAGNTTAKNVRRLNPDGTQPATDSLYTYDKLGRQITTTDALNFTYFSRYNAYGEIVAKGLNGIEQEYFNYDQVARMTKTNQDDGVNRAYLYDANGNQTAQIQSAITDTNLRPLTIAQIATLSPTLVQRTESVYDARNQLTATYQAPIDFTADNVAIQQVWVDALSDPFTGGTVTAAAGGGVTMSIRSIGSFTMELTVSWPPIIGFGEGNIKVVWSTGYGTYNTSVAGTATSASVNGQVSLVALENQNVKIFKETVYGDVLLAKIPATYIPSTMSFQFSTPPQTPALLHFTGQRADAQALQLYLWPAGGTKPAIPVAVPIAKNAAGVPIPGWFMFDWVSLVAGSYDYEFTTYDAAGAPLDHVQGQVTLTAASGGTVSMKIDGIFAPLLTVSWPPVVGFGSGNIRVDWINATGTYSVTVDGNATSASVRGSIFSTDIHQTVRVYKETAQGNILLAESPADYLYGPSGQGNPAATAHMLDVLNFTGQRSNAQSLKLYLWPAGGTKPATPVPVPIAKNINNTPIPGWFLFNWGSFGFAPGNYNYEFTTLDGAGNPLDSAQGKLSLGATPKVNSKFIDTVQPVLTPGDPVSNVIVRTQTHNAFGEITQEIDGRGYATQFVYNTRGQLIQKTDPETDATLESGAIVRVNPTTQYYYNAQGSTVAMRDANGNLTTQRYDASGNLVAEYHTDGGTKTYSYDIFGNKRFVNNEINELTRFTYDKKNQVTRVDRQTDAAFGYAARYDLYYYDEAGRRIKHTNSLGDAELTYYDDIGRVKKTVSYGGISTTYRYIYDAASGGSTSITTLGDGRSLSDTKNYFGRLLGHQDLGGRTYNYFYNQAGWLVNQTGDTNLAVAGNEQNITFSYYHNGYLREINDTGINTRTRYEYDKNGNRTFEGYFQGGANTVYLQWSRAEYDELNRLKSIQDPKYQVSYEYDANGNRRHVYAYYHDGLNGSIQTQDYWYTYDSMNRFIVTKGALVDAEGNVIDVQANPSARGSGQVTAGANGVALLYNAASQRAGSTYTSNNETVNEIYVYAADGLLWQTHINGTKRAERSYNALGAATSYKEFDVAGAVKTSIGYSYTKDGQTKTENGPSGNSIYYYDNAGTLTRVETAQTGGTTLTTTYSYAYWDSAKQTEIKVQASNANAPGWAPGFSKFTYDVNGHLTAVSDVAADRHLSYRLDADGRILQRNELIGTESSRTQSYYYLNGIGIGDAGSFGASRTDYASVLKQHEEEAYWRSQADLLNYKLNDKVREGVQGQIDQHQREVERNKAKPVRSADFDYSYQAISDRYPAMAPGTYTVQAGDSLQSIALKVWGDAGLWYLIADANGLADSAGLTAGQVLVIPNVVANIHNNASTFQVYNPGQLIGYIAPTLPDPPPPPKDDKGCGVVGMVILAIVAVVISYFTFGTTSAYFALLFSELGMSAGAAVVAGAVVAGALTSAATQLVAMGMGLQDEFDWGGVAIAGLTAGLTQGIVPEGADAMTRAVRSNLISQGVNMVAGRQENFSWSSLAVSAISAPINSAIDQNAAGVTNATSTLGATSAGFGADLMTGFAKGLVTQGASLLVNKGGKIEWANIAGQALGNAIGNAMAADIYQSGRIAERGAQIADFGRRGYGYDINPNGSLSVIGPRTSTPVMNTGNSVVNTGSSPATRPYTAQSGDTVWGLTGGDPDLIGDFRRLNNLSDADMIYAGKDYIVPTQVQDPEVARASYEQQAALWQSKGVAAMQAAEAQGASNISMDEAFALAHEARMRDPVKYILESRPAEPVSEMRALTPWETLRSLPYVGGTIRANISFADSFISGFGGLGSISSDLYNYATGENRSVITGDFYPSSALGASIQTRGVGQTALDMAIGMVHAPVEVLSGLYHNDPEAIGRGLAFWAPFAVAGTLGRVANSVNPQNIANAPRLAEQLTLESANSPFTSNGLLARHAIEDSKMIFAPGELSNPAIPEGFGKYTTQTFQSPSGDFQAHFYKNPSTGEVFYGLDYKAVFNKMSGVQ